MSRPSVGIIGGGILGLTAAYRLAQAGVNVTVHERATDLGGLVGAFDLDDHRVDRFYHVVLPTDDRVIGLAGELGLGDRFRFRPTRVGFFDGGRLFSMSSLPEFLRFPLLPPTDRLRLAAFVARCQLISDHSRLDDIPLLDWLERHCGRRIVERLWRPLLDSKFDGDFADLPATYIWARTRRMSKTRDSGGREVMGWLEGGYETLVDALVHAIRQRGGEVHAESSVDAVIGNGRAVTGLVVGGRTRTFDTVLCTLTPPQAQPLLAGLGDHLPADPCRYLGVVCVVLRTRRSVSPYYTLNITDRRVPLTTVVETTHVVDPTAVGGTLLYAVRYLDPDHNDLRRPVEDIEEEYVRHVRSMFPTLVHDDVLASSVQRSRVVEPVHRLGGAAQRPEMFPMPGLALASTVHVYPEIVNGQAVIGVADRVVSGVLERLPTAWRAAA